MVRVMLLLGGNIGHTESYIERAVEIMGREIGRITKRSRMIQSKPWGFEDRVGTTPTFVNQAVEIETNLAPEALLNATQRAEAQSGRERDAEHNEKVKRGEKYASRKIDIDIIFYGNDNYNSERLTLPHPLMQEREFVLGPIVEINSEWIHPTLRKSCRELLIELKMR